MELCWAQWQMPIIPATPWVEVGRIEVRGQLRQKVNEDPISINKPGMVEHICGVGGPWSEASPG
jgi:hypothetical protein